MLKLNFDGYSLGNPGEVGYGCIVQDGSGKVIWVQWGYVTLLKQNVLVFY